MSASHRSPYADAVDSTRELIIERARRYKRLVVCLSIGTLGVLALAPALPVVLLAALLLPALVISYFALDLASARRWRQVLLKTWARGQIDLAVVDSMLRKAPMFPAPTVEGLLDTLPPATPGLAPKVRLLIADAHELLDGVSILRLWLRAAFWAVSAGGAIGALATGHVDWLGLWLPLLPAIGVWRVVSLRLTRNAQTRLSQGMRDGSPDSGCQPGLPNALNWDGVPAHCMKHASAAAGSSPMAAAD